MTFKQTPQKMAQETKLFANSNAMNTIEQAVDKTEEVMIFPMLFPIKVMGLSSESFKQLVFDIAKQHFEDFDESLSSVEYSRTRKYMSVTVTVNARSREQLDDAYRAYTSNPEVKYVL